MNSSVSKTKKSEAQLRADKKYFSKFHEVKLRLLPDEYENVKKHAAEAGDANVTAFIKRAISETIERDQNE